MDAFKQLKATFPRAQIIDSSKEFNLDQITHIISNTKVTQPVVIVNIIDHFIYSTLIKTFTNDSPNDIRYVVSETIEALHTKAQEFPLTNFIVLTENVFVNRELEELAPVDNLYFVSSISEFVREINDYRTIEPIIDKEESSTYILSLNNNPRPHRVNTVMYLMFKDLQNVSTISLMSVERIKSSVGYDYRTFLDWSYWNETKVRKVFDSLHKSNFNGYQFLKEEVYTEHYSNYQNFKNKLNIHYKHSLVEVITESTCIEPSLCLTEKFVNSMFGCVFPILISTQGTVQFLRDLGFDMFDDIIDHSYDSEPNHFYRMRKAFDLNYEWLSNKHKVMIEWNKNKQRFLSNVLHYNNNLYDQEFNRIMQDISSIKCRVT